MAVVLLGVLTMEQAYRSIAWNTVVLVGGMMALSAAMIETGAATSDVRRPDCAGGRCRAARAALRAVPADGRARAVDQQHGDGADRDPDRPLGGRRDGGQPEDRPDVGGGDLGGRAAHAGRDPGQPDGHGPGRVPLHRLLEARPAAAHSLRRGGGAPRSRHLAVLTEGANADA